MDNSYIDSRSDKTMEDDQHSLLDSDLLANGVRMMWPFSAPKSKVAPRVIIRNVLGETLLELRVRDLVGSTCLRGKDLSHASLQGQRFFGAASGTLARNVPGIASKAPARLPDFLQDVLGRLLQGFDFRVARRYQLRELYQLLIDRLLRLVLGIIVTVSVCCDVLQLRGRMNADMLSERIGNESRIAIPA